MMITILTLLSCLFAETKPLMYEVKVGDKYCLKVIQNGPQVCGTPSEQPKLTKLGFFDSVKDMITDRSFCPIKKANIANYNKDLIKDNIREQIKSKKLKGSELDFYIITQKHLYVEYNADCSFSVIFQHVIQAEYPGYCYQDVRGGGQNVNGKDRNGLVTDGYYIVSKIYQFYVTKSNGSEIEYYDKETKDWFDVTYIR